MSGLSLWTIEDSLATLLGAREELLAESQQPNPTRESAEISTEITEVEKALAEYLAREVAKVDGVHSYLRWAEANASAARVEAQQMAERARRLESGAKRLRQMCCDIMAQRGLKRLEGTGGRVLLRRGNGGLAPLNVQPEILPIELRDVVVRVRGDVAADMEREGWAFERLSDEPSNGRIRGALAAGPVPGASLGERGESLQVK